MEIVCDTLFDFLMEFSQKENAKLGAKQTRDYINQLLDECYFELS